MNHGEGGFDSEFTFPLLCIGFSCYCVCERVSAIAIRPAWAIDNV